MAPNDQTWLYRQGDLILGPVGSKVIVEKLFAGELSPSSDVQLMGTGVFKKIGDVREFQVHVAKAAAKQRVDAQSMVEAKLNRKRTLKILAVGAALVGMAVIGTAVLGSWLAVHAVGAEMPDVEIEALKISAATRAGDDMLEYAGGGRKPGSGGARPTRPAANTGSPGKPAMGQADSEGMAMSQVDESAITAVVTRYKPTLIPCLKLVATPGMVAKVPIEFAIGDGGKVSKVWVDNPDFKEGPLPECLLKALQKWPFKTADGAGGTVKLSFNIGKG